MSYQRKTARKNYHQWNVKCKRTIYTEADLGEGGGRGVWRTPHSLPDQKIHPLTTKRVPLQAYFKTSIFGRPKKIWKSVWRQCIVILRVEDFFCQNFPKIAQKHFFSFFFKNLPAAQNFLSKKGFIVFYERSQNLSIWLT